MDKRDALSVAKLYSQAVSEKFNETRFYLFGSYVKGDFRKDSDIDIAVILKDYDNLFDIQLELMRLRRKIDSRIEPHPFREVDFVFSDPFVSEIISYGKEIIL